MKRMSILALIFCACHAPVAWGQQPAANGNSDWTQFHRTNMERWNPYEHFLNVKNVSRLSVKWSDPGDGYSSPAVANGVVYTGSSSGNVSARNAKPHSDVSALDAKTGARLWSYATGDNYLTSSPAVANGLVYFGPSGKGSTGWYALNARTGVPQWGYYIYDAEYSSAAVANGVVYVGAESAGLYAFDARSGALLWSYRTGNKDSGYTSPAVANGVVYFGSDNNVYAVNANTGVVLWTYAAGKWTEKVLHSFAGGTDGANPNGGLVVDSKGGIYGTTTLGGDLDCKRDSVGCGTVFELAPPARRSGMRPEKILKRFTGETDGDGPNGGLILDAKGSLFGTTGLGGTGNGLGVVFQLAPQPGRWAETVLYSFQGENDGRNPGPLTRDSTGTLYGVAGGGAYFSGVVFRLKPPSQKTWPFALLYIFRRPPDGGGPEAHLILDGAGNLYSTTVAGGDSGNGTVFRVTR